MMIIRLFVLLLGEMMLSCTRLEYTQHAMEITFLTAL